MSLATRDLLLETFRDANIAIYYKDVRGRYLFINEAGARMLGSTADQMLRLDDHQIFARRTADVIRLRDQHVASMTSPLAFECQSLLLGQDRPTPFYSVKRRVQTVSGNAAGLLGLSLTGAQSSELLGETRGVVEGLVRLRPECLLEVCRRGARLDLI
jgi:PAS domain-containing protein